MRCCFEYLFYDNNFGRLLLVPRLELTHETFDLMVIEQRPWRKVLANLGAHPRHRKI